MSLDFSEHRLVPPASTCMIVEDEALIAIALKGVLGDAGFTTTGPFARSSDAVASLDRERPGVAILDAVLKDGSSLDLARALIRLDIPFVVYSGSEQLHAGGPEFDGVPWLLKPAPYPKVVAAVREAVRRSPA